MPAACSVFTMVLNSPSVPARRVAQVGREEADRVVAPVVAQAVLHQARSSTKAWTGSSSTAVTPSLSVLDHRRGGQPGVGAAQLLRDVGMALREALDVHLVDDRVLPGGARRAVVAPAEGGVDDLAAAEARAGSLPANQPSVRIEQHLRGIEAVSVLRVVRPVDPIAIEQAGPRVGKVAMPDEVGALAHVERSTSRRPLGSNRHSSTRSACSENSAKLTPAPSQVAPRG